MYQVGRAVKAPDLKSGLRKGVVRSVLTPGNSLSVSRQSVRRLLFKSVNLFITRKPLLVTITDAKVGLFTDNITINLLYRFNFSKKKIIKNPIFNIFVKEIFCGAVCWLIMH